MSDDADPQPGRPGQPTFTVVMPAYNHAEYVGEAIDSVVAQTFDDWELIVVDDGSTDDTAEVARTRAERDGRIKIVSQANAGPAAARNNAIARSSGEWITFLDSDDVWYPRTLATYAKAVAAHPGQGFFHGRRDRLDAAGTVAATTGEFQDRPTGTPELFGRMFLSTMVSCISRELIERVGAFDEGLRSCEDYELFLRLSLLTSFVPVGASTGMRRRHGRNISRQTGFSRFQEAEVLKRFVTRQGGAEVLAADLVDSRLADLYCASARQYFRAGCFRKGVAAARESLGHARTFKTLAIKAACLALLPLGRDDGRDLPRL
jgi:glycosyltransferase involved in cell wall biosynthesis